MYICQACNKQVESGVSPLTRVTEKRRKTYPERYRIAAPKGHEQRQKRIKIDNGGEGWEIVREIRVCADCAKFHTGLR